MLFKSHDIFDWQSDYKLLKNLDLYCEKCDICADFSCFQSVAIQTKLPYGMRYSALPDMRLTSHVDNHAARSRTVVNGTVGPECDFCLSCMQICL